MLDMANFCMKMDKYQYAGALSPKLKLALIKLSNRDFSQVVTNSQHDMMYVEIFALKAQKIPFCIYAFNEYLETTEYCATICGMGT